MGGWSPRSLPRFSDTTERVPPCRARRAKVVLANRAGIVSFSVSRSALPHLRFSPSFILGLLLLLAGNLSAQVTRDFAIDLKADVSPTVPHITLTWTLRLPASISAQVIHRRLKGAATWVQQASPGASATSYADNTAVPGVEYEYWMQRTYTAISPNTAVGYITAGANLPMVEDRGKLLLVVDQAMAAPLAPEIDQLRNDLTADGWLVQTIVAARRDSLTDVTAVADTKALIKAAYDADPANVKQVYLLGHVPVPYAGNSAWDGHGNHSGAWSADGYYGDMDGVWTDSSVNNGVAANVRLTNIPGDGRLDQSTIPSTLELMVGRVDLVNMQRAPAANVSEISLLRRYLRKAHDFKYKLGAYANVQRRVLIRDGFGTFGSEGFMRTGWAWGFTGVGRPPEVTFDEAPSGNWWTLAATNTYLMANGNGGGSYETCGSVGATADFGRRPFRAAFVSLFGSYFGDWDVTNNFMRAPLAGNATGDGLGLCAFWAGRPSFFMHHMATGETLGYSMRQSMNSQFTSVSNPVYTPVNFGGGGTHCGLLGDPSLRMHVVEPPRNFTATSAGGQVSLAWNASAETALLGYHVYRAATPAGPFTRITATPLGAPNHVDATGAAGTPYTYMVRTLKLETAPGGTYENLSQGSMVALTVNAGATAAPLNPNALTVTQASAANALLSWVDNATDETAYRVERKVNGTGSFAPLITLAPGSASFTDPGPFTAGSTYFYRVFATSAAGDSARSEEVSFEAVAGFFEFDATTTKASKTAGTAPIMVKRFGGVTGAVSVDYATADSSAIADTHYTAKSGTLNWTDGETGPKIIDVPIINNASAQQARQFRLTLSNPSEGTGIGTYNSVAVLIEDPTAPLPVPWNQSLIGTVTGSSPAVNAEGGLSSTTLGGSGLATQAAAEVGQFIYQTRTGDGVMTARVPAASPAQSGARYAIMIRENATGGGALMAGTATSSSTGYGSKFVYRTTSGGTAIFTGNANSAVTPQWLRITRAGNSFTSECSADGSSWISLGSATVAMNSTAQWGFFHHSDDLSATTYSGNFQTASFTNVTFGTVSVPNAPGAFALTQPAPSQVALTWTAAPSAAGYRIERRTETGTFAQIVDLDGGAVGFNDDAVMPNTGYEYRIYAFNSSGNSALSAVLRATTPPADVSVNLTTESNAQSGDASVRASGTTTNFGSQPVLTVNGLSSANALTPCSKIYLRFDLSGLPPTLKTATLRLAVAETRNLAQVGYSFSSILYVHPDSSDAWGEGTITWANAPLNQTTGTSFLGGVSFVNVLSFSNPLTVPTAGTVLGLDADADTITSLLGANGLITLGMVTSTKAAVDFASREHPTLPPPTLAVTYASPLPTRPSFLTATPGTGSSIDLAWLDNSSAETGFEIERRPAGGTFAVIQSPAANSTAFNDAATTLGVTYEYRIRATSAAGNSAWSPVVAATAGGGTGLPGERMTFQSWLRDHNLAADADPAGDSDGDGLPDMLEYALGLPPDLASTTGAPTPGQVMIGNERFLTLTFARRLDAIGMMLTVEASGSLEGPWITLDPLQPENQVSVEQNVPFPGWQNLTIKDTTPINLNSPRFMRLRATVP